MNRILLVLGYAGVCVAGVLSLAAALEKDPPCGLDNGCARVAADETSRLLFGIPNAYFGFVAYLVLAIFATYREIVGFDGPKPRLTMNLGYAFAALGTIASIILTVISIMKIHATCKWCLASATIMTLTLFTYMLLTIKSEKAPKAPARGALSMLLIVGMPVLSLGGIAVAARNFTIVHTSVKTLDPQVVADMVGGGPAGGTPAGPDIHMKNPDGVVTLVEFGDLDCPTCKHLYPQIEQMVDNSHGRIRFIFHHFPLYKKPDHPGALVGAAVSEIAAETGKFWEYLDTVYGNGDADPAAPPPGPDDMLNFGQHIGLDRAMLEKRVRNLDDPAVARVTRDLNLCDKYAIGHTPEFLIWAGNQNYTQCSGNEVFGALKDPKFAKLLKGP